MALGKLYDNYERDMDIAERHTAKEKMEEDGFIDQITPTNPIKMLKAFLISKGMLSVRFTGVVVRWQKLRDCFLNTIVLVAHSRYQ